MKKNIFILVMVMGAMNVVPVFAESNCVTNPTAIPCLGAMSEGKPVVVTQKLENPIKYNNFTDFVAAVVDAAVRILLPFVVLAFIWSGFLFIHAQGKPEEIKKAQQAILWSIVGAFILLGAAGFAAIIRETVKTVIK